MAKMLSVRDLKIDIPKEARLLADQMLSDLEKSKRPVLEAVKTTLDNSFYNPKVGYLTPGDKVVRTELNVSSVQKLARVVFILEILLNGLQRMEYRGYDSAGLEIDGDTPDKPLIFKEVGKVKNLRQHCFESKVDMDRNFLSQTSIAHTRSVSYTARHRCHG